MLEKYYPTAYCKDVFNIDYQKLYDLGIKAIIFDIDNTLVHHGDNSTPQVDEFIKQVQSIGLKTLFLSNNDQARVERFLANIDAPYICVADKPNTQGYHKAIEILEVDKSEAVFIGDQMFVDILGANRSGMNSILVHFIRLPNEKKIGKKRYIEMIILFFYRLNKKYYNKFGNIQKEKI